jgi:hypothetical protein
MDTGFSHHVAERGQPHKCVLQSPEYRRRGRNGSALTLEARHNMTHTYLPSTSLIGFSSITVARSRAHSSSVIG